MIEYRLSSETRSNDAPEPLLEYVLGGNGVHVRGRRQGLDAVIPIAPCDVRGLPPVTPYVQLETKVPACLLAVMLARAREVCARKPQEVLFHLVLTSAGDWQLVEPPQEATATSVRPTESAWSTSQAIVEIHSHHEMGAFFSGTDDEDERAGFRVYGVLGRIWKQPQIALRVGLHGYFWRVPASEVFA